MNKTLSVMLAAGLLVSGVAGAAEKPAVAFTPEQEARIGEIAKDYLLAHPEVLVEVSQKLQAQQQEKQQQAMTAAVVQNQAALLNDKGTPSYGPADAKVTVVEFFDYQCIYCARLAPELEKVIKLTRTCALCSRNSRYLASAGRRRSVRRKPGFRSGSRRGPMLTLTITTRFTLPPTTRVS